MQAGATKVLKVTLSIGEMTEAIEDALTFAYEAITDGDPLFSGSKLDITWCHRRAAARSVAMNLPTIASM